MDSIINQINAYLSDLGAPYVFGVEEQQQKYRLIRVYFKTGDVETAETKQTQWRTQQSMSDYLSGILRGLCIGQVLRE